MIKKLEHGNHSDVITAEFGQGDIMMCCAYPIDTKQYNQLICYNNDFGHKPGDTSNEFTGKSTDELQRPDLVLRFNNIEGLNAIIDSLTELKEMFGKTDSDLKP